jgi:hypothetical protein
MGHAVPLVLGMVLLVLGAQGGIRLLVDHEEAGVPEWLPGGFPAQLGCFVVLAVVGATTAARSAAHVRRSGSDR